jgi:hypothetical protein
VLRFFCSPDREDDRDSHGRNPSTRGDASALEEYLRRVSVELEPPDEESERLIDRLARDHEPGGPKLGLATQRKASTTIDTSRSWPQSILVVDMPRGDAQLYQTFNTNPLAVVMARTMA